jgi:hypothetical protein
MGLSIALAFAIWIVGATLVNVSGVLKSRGEPLAHVPGRGPMAGA